MIDVLEYVVGVLILVVVLALSIALHEIGHLVPAKKFGVKVTQYMVGFGRTLWSTRRGETEYGVKWLPLGGYIRMIGMFPPRPGEDEHHLRESSTGTFQSLAEDARAMSAQEIAPGDEHRVFYKLPVHQKVIIMLGGPMMNLLIAFVLFGILLVGFGDIRNPVSTTTIDTVSACMRTAAEGSQPCTDADETTPAAKAGVQPGDQVVELAGEPVTSWSQVQQLVRARAGQETSLVVERLDGTREDLSITPVENEVVDLAADGTAALDADGEPLTVTAGFVGVTPTRELVRQSPAVVPGYTAEVFTGTVGIIARLPVRMVDVVQAAFGTEERDPNGPIGLVGVGRITGEIASYDEITLDDKVASLLSVLASLNMALFVFNLVPLLPLDGGHVAGALWEGLRRQLAKVRRRPDPGPVDVAKALPLVYAVSGVMVVMFVILLYADIVRPISIYG